MDINDLFDGIIKSIKQFADLSACVHLPARCMRPGAQAGEIAVQRLQERLQQIGRGPENEGNNSENFEPKKKRGMADFPKRE